MPVKGSKTLTLFDHLDGLTSKKTKWEELTESDRKTFSPYMINRFLSMQVELTEFVNDIQRYTTSLLTPREVYNLYLDLLPKKKIFFRYIKSKAEEKYNPKLIEYLCKYYECSGFEAIQYLHIFLAKEESKQDLIRLLQGYGLTEKEVNKLFK